MGFPVFTHSLADDLPYEDIIDDVIIYSDGSVGCAFEITPIYVDSMEYTEIMNLERTLAGFITGLEANVHVQVIWRKTSLLTALDSHMNQIQSGDPLLQTMAYERQKYWEEKRDSKNIFGITCQIWFRKHYDRMLSKPFNTIWSMGANETAAMESLLAEQEKIGQDFKNLCARLMSPIATITKIKRMDSSAIFATLWSYLCGQEYNAPEYTSSVPVKNRFDGIDVTRDWGYLTIGNMHDRNINILSCRDVPEYSSMSMINYLLNIPLEFTLVMNIGTLAQGRLRNELRKQMARHESVIISKISPEATKRAREISGLLIDLDSTTNQLVNFEMFMIVPNSDLRMLSDSVKFIADVSISQMNMRLEQEKAALWPIFLASLPGACKCGTVKREIMVKTVNVVNFLPVLGPIQSSDRSIMLMGGPYHSLFAYDPFDSRLAASHMLVFGGTGSGKSFTANLMLLSMASQNPLIFIIDKGGSYKKLVKMLGGSYIDLSVPGVSFNPLEGKANWRAREKAIQRILTETIREDPSIPITTYQSVIISRWVEALYQTFNSNPANKDREPTLSDAYEILTKVRMFNDKTEAELNEVQRKIAITFSRWTRLGTRNKSSYAQILDNEKTNVSLDNNIIAFDLLGLEQSKELMNVVFLTINNIIMSRATDPKILNQKKIIVFDEVWSLLKSEEGATFIEELYRTMRKYNAMVMSITQDIEDFSNSSVARALLSNTHQMMILRQTTGSNSERIGKILDLNQSEEELIKTLSQSPGLYSEVFLKMSGVGSGRMCIAPSPVEYWFATTKAEDRDLIENYQKQGYSLEKTIEELAQKYPHGRTFMT